ncbi:MAG: (2Fe-2S)-binding protein [Desulfovibrionales bacterium]
MSKDHKKEPCTCKKGLTRRGFLTSMGVGALSVAVSGPLQSRAGAQPQKQEDNRFDAVQSARITLNINGVNHRLMVEPRWTLLHVLREELGFTGTKVGCERGECGACTVLIDDIPRYSCLTLAVEAEGMKIETLEGLMLGERLGPVQETFLENDGYQCGYCTPGQIVAAEGFLRNNPDPGQEDIPRAMSGNLCRCGAYPNIFSSVQAAAKKRSRGGES